MIQAPHLVLPATPARSSSASTWHKPILSLSLASGRCAITFLIYLIIVPFLAFFFLKDKEEILRRLQMFVPEEHDLSEQVWHEVDRQMGRYIRGKFLAIPIVWGASYLTFHILAAVPPISILAGEYGVVIYYCVALVSKNRIENACMNLRF
jgi:putative permease